MPSTGSVTHWIHQLKAGDHVAAQHLWENYFRTLIQRARQRLAGLPRRAADEEDVALSAFDTFCRGAAEGRFPQLHDRHDLWQLLVVITDRKAIDLVHHERRLKRGGTKVPLAGTEAAEALDQALSREPSPEFAAQLAEEYQRLLRLLGETELQQIAVRKLEGYTVREIAAQFQLLPRTVQRRLELIRRLWQQELLP
jgi:DNA-directed RNA polymerase specialized sigma24 family protein